MLLEIYTDGSTRKNGFKNNIGGWAFVIQKLNGELECYNGVESNTTNQRCELIAAIMACEKATQFLDNLDGFDKIIIHSDSAYLINCYKQKWYANWERNGWVNAKKQPVANIDLWKRLIPFFNDVRFSFLKVKGHSGDRLNELTDLLAKGDFPDGYCCTRLTYESVYN